MSIQVTINGDMTVLEEIETVAELLGYLRADGRIAVEINGEIIPRSGFAQHTVRDGDRIEVVCAIGGG